MTIAHFRISAIVVLFGMVANSASVLAHEFWIAPVRGVLMPGDTIVAGLMVGRMLRGADYPYLSNRFRSFTVAVGKSSKRVAGNEGDIPALAYSAERRGLHVIAHHTIAFRVTHDDWMIFRRYLRDEGLDTFADRHRARGLPDQGFFERYTRYAKALVQAGPADPADQDIRVGLPLELVAEANPYAAGVGRLPVTLIWNGAPLANRQINIFRDDGIDSTVTRTKVVTDQDGRALIPLLGNGDYLLNSVHLEPVDAAPVVWASHWASLSFKLQNMAHDDEPASNR